MVTPTSLSQGRAMEDIRIKTNIGLRLSMPTPFGQEHEE